MSLYGIASFEANCTNQFEHLLQYKDLTMKQSSYQQSNKQLYELHLQRLKRKGQTMQEEPLSKIIKIEQKKLESVDASDDIFLNSVIYDQRQSAAKYNNVTFAQFLHEEVRMFPSKSVSKNVEGIFITTYGYEPEVFLPIVKSKVPLFLVNRQGEQKNGFVKKSYNGFENWTLISPPKENTGYGVFHTKLWLIKFSTFLRVVVCTSNHHLCDWTVWQNAFWYHDCPLITSQENGQKKEERQKENKEKATLKDFDYEKDFFETLNWVIAEMLPKGYDLFSQMKLNLKDYSFKGIEVILIPSLPGRFKCEHLNKVGIGKVKKIMCKCSLQLKKPMMTYNCTSLGKPDQKFIRQLYFAFNPSTFQFYPDRFRLVYPTQKYINQETCGEAQVLFLTKESYEKCELKNHIFHRYEESPTNGVLGGIPHLKTVIVQEGEKQQDRCVVYVGSHNFTRAAWGTYEKNESQISMSNSELGLLFLNYSKERLLKWLPYKYPPAKYSNGDRPFFKQMG